MVNILHSWLYIWLIILIIAIVVEIITVGLTSIWMAGGAAVALVAAALNAPVWLQMLLFFGVTIVLLIFTRPWAMKYLNNRRTATNNNDEPIGKEVRVVERIDNRQETGKVMHRGIEWTARAIDPEEVIEVDEFAHVVEVQGVKLLVKKVTPVAMRRGEDVTEQDGAFAASATAATITPTES